MFSARERGFGPEEAEFSFRWPNPRFSARERGFAYYPGGREGGCCTLTLKDNEPYNWPRLMFSARERGFGPEEAEFSFSWPNPRFSARERGFAYYADGAAAQKADLGRRLVTMMGSGPWGTGRGVLHAYAEGQ